VAETRLILIDGLPGVGKTTIARELARTTGGLHLRIDSIEQALRNCGLQVQGEGYEVGYAVADCVNPWPLTRNAWRAVAVRADVASLDVEVICSDQAEHRRRVESRTADIAGHQIPTWQEVVERDYYPWDDQPRLIIDTAILSVDQALRIVLQQVMRDAAP